MQSKVTNETKRADKSDFESKRVQEKLTGLQKENDRLAQQVQSYKDKHEEMEFSKLTQMSSDANTGNLYVYVLLPSTLLVSYEVLPSLSVSM